MNTPIAMMFTLREKFIASDAWMRLWYVASLGLAFYLLSRSLEVTQSALESPLFLLLGIFAVIATILLTLFLSPFVAFVVFQGMTERQGRRNGGPFGIGDRVVVIAGRDAGRQGFVTSYGQCRTLRITLDGDDIERGAYSDYHLKRVD